MDFTKPGIPGIGAVISGGGSSGKNASSSMSYHENGKRLYVAYGQENKLHIIDCLNGKLEQPALRCDREQIHIVQSTHHEQNVLFAGQGTNTTQPIGQRYAISYWSVYDNKILRKFRGHTDLVTHLSMCPANDTFLTSSLDNTVRLWTMNQAGCIAEMKLPDKVITNNKNHHPMSIFDSTGLVFAITAAMPSTNDNDNNNTTSSSPGGQYLHLYDARNYGAGAFAELKILQKDMEKAIQSNYGNTNVERAQQLSRAPWTSLQFNASGNQILVGTSEPNMSILLDGFEGTVQRVLLSENNASASTSFSSSSDPSMVTATSSSCCYTPDDQTVLQGKSDGTIACWNVNTGSIVQTLSPSGHPDGSHVKNCVAANPMYTQIASSCKQTALWTW